MYSEVRKRSYIHRVVTSSTARGKVKFVPDGWMIFEVVNSGDAGVSGILVFTNAAAALSFLCGQRREVSVIGNVS
jgi:hypothetical protein